MPYDQSIAMCCHALNPDEAEDFEEGRFYGATMIHIETGTVEEWLQDFISEFDDIYDDDFAPGIKIFMGKYEKGDLVPSFGAYNTPIAAVFIDSTV